MITPEVTGHVGPEDDGSVRYKSSAKIPFCRTFMRLADHAFCEVPRLQRRFSRIVALVERVAVAYVVAQQRSSPD